MTRTIRRLYDLSTGKQFASFELPPLLSVDTKWSRAVSAVAEHFECDPDDVDCVETEDGDRITVGGEVVASWHPACTCGERDLVLA